MKNFILISAIILALVGCFIGYYHNGKAFRSQEELNVERFTRMTVEENLLKSENKISSLKTELEQLQIRLKNTEKLLSQTTEQKDNLQIQLDQALEAKKVSEGKVVNEVNKLVEEVLVEAADGI